DSKRYPAIDPIDSYSKYLEYPEIQEYLKKEIAEDWVDNVTLVKDILLRGKEASEQINILGDDGVPIDYHLRYWKAEVIDFVILQQDAYDSIDKSSHLNRQKFMLDQVLNVYNTDFKFDSFEEVNPYFKSLINFYKQMNYSEYESEKFNNYLKEIETKINERKAV
ncbi:MAG: V-type ATP synthase subunit A, partial [Candidatus Delongbacteria bacterium]|nr:V-type ATP synthase subunit A [Candidatus Delongbacteria bacterium]